MKSFYLKLLSACLLAASGVGMLSLVSFIGNANVANVHLSEYCGGSLKERIGDSLTLAEVNSKENMRFFLTKHTELSRW